MNIVLKSKVETVSKRRLKELMNFLDKRDLNYFFKGELIIGMAKKWS